MDTFSPTTKETIPEKIERLERERTLYKAIIEEVAEGIMALDQNGTIILYNKEIAKTEELNPEEVIGKKELEIYSDPDYDFPQMLNKLNIRNKSILNERYFYKTPNGKEHHIIYSSYPFYYNGEYQGLFSIGRDVMQINDFIQSTLTFENQLKQKKTSSVPQNRAYYFFDNIIGSSSAMKKTVHDAKKIASYDVPVMIIGETGTGKELFAQSIHNESSRCRGPFVSVNCAAIPEALLESILFGTSKGAFTGAMETKGLFEQAKDGSLFLDEINSMPLSLQGKILRAIQEKRVRPLGGKNEIQVNCRIISATNQDLFENMEEQTTFRSDLLFRLSVAVIHIPPLRERKDDIVELSRYFMRKAKQSKSIFLWEISSDLLDLFFQYPWPGNVRELENIISSSLIFTENQERILKTEHIPEHLRKKFFKSELIDMKDFIPGDLKNAVGKFEKNFILETILSTKGNMAKTAKILNISRQNLYAKIHKYQLEHLLNDKSVKNKLHK